nr:MAG: hypothetical protein 2 [Leviviridae sp.]
MFNDPSSVTYNTVATSMPKVDTGNRRGVYESADNTLRLTISHANGKRERSEVRLDHKKTAADPLDPTKNRPYDMSVYLVVNRPANGIGYTDAEAQLVYDALTAFITNTTNRGKILGGES